MGLSYSWIAVRGLRPEQALAALELEVSKATEPDYLPVGISMAPWPDGWLILVSDVCDVFGGTLTQLAAFGPAVECQINEHVMYSEARGYADGKGVWRVVHNPERGLFSVQVAGNPPPELRPLMHRKRAHQHAAGGRNAGLDYIYEIPPLLARSICGFQLGETEPDNYLQLRPIGSAERHSSGAGFFARLVGRRRVADSMSPVMPKPLKDRAKAKGPAAELI